MHGTRKEPAEKTKKASNIRIIKSKGETDLTVSPKRFKKDMNGSNFNHINDMMVKPRLLESKAHVHDKFRDLSPAFQTVFANKNDENMKLPVVGYAGHRKSQKAENFFAKNFRDGTYYSEYKMR